MEQKSLAIIGRVTLTRAAIIWRSLSHNIVKSSAIFLRVRDISDALLLHVPLMCMVVLLTQSLVILVPSLAY